MATVVVTRPDLFPAATEVEAYAATVFGVPSSGAPFGTPAETEIVAGDGTLTLDELAAGTSYILYAALPDRYLRVNTSAGSSGGGGVSQEDVDDSIATHAADETAVHGISDTAALKGFVFWTEGGVPARPDFGSVEWIGPDDPDTDAEDGDTWVPTEAP